MQISTCSSSSCVSTDRQAFSSVSSAFFAGITTATRGSFIVYAETLRQ